MLQLTRRVMFGPLKEPITDHAHAGDSHKGHAQTSHSVPHGHEHHGAAKHGHETGSHDSHGHGTPEPKMSNLPDLSWRELGAIVPLAVAILWIGLFPQFIIDRMLPSITQVVENLHDRRGKTTSVAQNLPAKTETIAKLWDLVQPQAEAITIDSALRIKLPSQRLNLHQSSSPVIGVQTSRVDR